MAGADQMRQYTYDALKAELQSLGFLFQGSLQTRRIACGKTTCRCYHDPPPGTRRHREVQAIHEAGTPHRAASLRACLPS